LPREAGCRQTNHAGNGVVAVPIMVMTMSETHRLRDFIDRTNAKLLITFRKAC
jgi:hypothetical protein